MRRTAFISSILVALGLLPAAVGAAGSEHPIVYMGLNDADFDLFMLTPDGRRPIVTAAGHDCGPAIAVDGRLVFASAREGVMDLYLQTGPDAEPVRLTSSSVAALFPSWSPDGGWIAYGKDGAIWKMRPDDPSTEQRLTDASSGLYHSAPVWSPDGAMIAYWVGADPIGLVPVPPSIWIVGADGSDARPLIEDALEPAWHPDGTVIAFASTAGRAPGFSDLAAIDFDPDSGTVMTTTRRVLHGGAGAAFAPTYSPEGSLAYAYDPDGRALPASLPNPGEGSHDLWVGGPEPSQIWVLGEAEARTADPFGASNPSFAPHAGWWGS
ncbi:MAG TPA: hypothetical protein VGB52_02990 [Actinomycetota bacterium]